MRNKNPSPNPDLHFIEGKYNQSYNGIEFTITSNSGEIKVFTPKQYLRLVLDHCYEAVDNSKTNRKKIQALFNGETIIKRIIDGCDLDYSKFDGIFKDIEVISKRLNYYNEVDEKKSAIRTTALIAIIAAVLGGSVPELIKLFQKDPQPTYIVLPSSDLKTIPLKDASVLEGDLKDTSLKSLDKIPPINK